MHVTNRFGLQVWVTCACVVVWSCKLSSVPFELTINNFFSLEH